MASGPFVQAWPGWLAGAVLIALYGRGRAISWTLVAVLAGGFAASLESALEPPAQDLRAQRIEIRGTVTHPVEPWADGQRFTLISEHGLGVDVTVRGAAGTRPLPGDRVKVVGRLRGGRGYRNPGAAGVRARALASRGAQASVSVAAADLQIEAAGWSPWRGPVRARRALSAAIAARGGSTEGNALARAMALGERGTVPIEAQERFRDAGIAHLLAVSGLHVGVVALLLFGLVRRMSAAVPGLAARVDATVLAACVAGTGAVFYTALTGARTSTLRALVVVLVLLLGAMLSRRARFIDALGTAALLLAAMTPSVVFEPSFQLSFGAALVLAVTMQRGRAAELDVAPGRLARWRRRGQRRLLGLIAATLWVTAATAPIVAHAFGSLPLGGILANLVAVPLSELVILPCALAGALIAQLSAAAGAVFIDLAVLCASMVDDLAGFIARTLPPITVPALTGAELASWYAGVAAVIGWRRGWLRGRSVAIIIACAALVMAVSLARGHAAPERLRVTFVDVGQGDAALVELPSGQVWLIDAGGLPHISDDVPGERRREIGSLPARHGLVPLLRNRRIGHIDRVILSHPHPDHFRGLGALLGRVSVDQVWLARGSLEPERELAGLIEELRAEIVYPQLDARYDAGDGIGLTVLAPRYLDEIATADPVVSVNDNSLAVRLDRAGRSILFAGDFEGEGEAELLARGMKPADVIKVPHHGSPTSSSQAFVDAVAPSLAVISCGRGNRFGFPSAAVVERWRAAGARVLRTDLHGAISVELGSEGELLVEPFDP